MKVYRYGLLGFLVLIVAALFNLAALYTAERSFVALRETAGWVRQTQVAQNLVEHLYRLVVDAETGQRGYLLTGDRTYLEPYTDALEQSAAQLKELRDLTRDNPVQVAQLVTVESLLRTRFAQIEDSLAQKREQGDESVRGLLLSSQGATTMESLRLALDGMAAEEELLHERRFRAFADNQDHVRQGFFLVAGLNLFLVTLGAIFLSQDARRRRRQTDAARDRNVQLARAVQESTAELTELSHYLQRLQEEEKANIAREIHDELGGTLAAAKIDLQLLSDKLPGDSPHQTRIARVMAAIDDAIQVKRRIIEDLRPTILDHLGIGAAIKWQCSQFSQRSGVNCQVELQSENLRLSPAYSIAFYRAVQEGFTNIGKHAQAKNVVVSLQRNAELWVLRIVDDGLGFDMAQPNNPTAHGLLSMRERVRALGGEFSIKGQPGRGTVIEIRAPFENGLPV